MYSSNRKVALFLIRGFIFFLSNINLSSIATVIVALAFALAVATTINRSLLSFNICIILHGGDQRCILLVTPDRHDNREDNANKPQNEEDPIDIVEDDAEEALVCSKDKHEERCKL